MAKPRRRKIRKNKPVRRRMSGRRPVKHLVFDKRVYKLNACWPYFNELRNFILKIEPPSFEKIERRLARLGRVKLAVITGVFLGLADTRVDIMVVGDDIDFRKFGDFLKGLESDTGRELRYVILGVEEFKYRINMFDRFVHDIMEYPHNKVINKLGRLV